jgi:hypothetical protein
MSMILTTTTTTLTTTSFEAWPTVVLWRHPSVSLRRCLLSLRRPGRPPWSPAVSFIRRAALDAGSYATAASGYRRSVGDRLEQDPELRIRETLSSVFRRFDEIGSVRQYGFGRSELTCRLLSVVLKGGPRSDAGRANCLRLISALVSRK